ncbi:MAG: M56 family metallopeptidase, partial [Gemmatimonadaceae bacterium]|nr:M56 family metallopeptidase [Gemmatimonadaceae bacterium]
MIAWWMTQSLFIGAWLAGAAMLLDVAMRRLGRSARGVWVAALLGLAALTAWSIGRPETPVPPAAMSVESPVPAATAAVPAASLPWGNLFAVPQELLRHAGRAILRWEASLALEPWLGGLWLALSALTALALLGLHARVAVRRRRWPVLGDIDGVPVRIADDEGPCVIGLVPAEIVLPAWAASLPDGARALIIAHEREHVRGGDPWLFAVANAVLVALPWHPLAWWMQARLRLAIEVDCDRRCLAGGTDTGTYG